jgi:hypothetical protein
MLGLALCASAALAVWPTPEAGTRPAYWLKGIIQGESMLAGRPVVLYSTTFDPTKVVTAELTPDTGHTDFIVNAYDLYFYHKLDNYTEAGGKPALILAIVRDPASSDTNIQTFGTQEIVNIDWAKGYVDELVLTLVAGGGPVIGQGQIAGVVTNETGSGVLGATIVANTGATALSNSSGGYLLGNFEPNNYNLSCSATGYSPVNRTAAVVANQVTWANFILGGAVPFGTVPLNVTRVTDGGKKDVVFTWDQTTYPNTKLFVLTGDGSGSYTNDYTKWSSLADYAAAHPGQFDDVTPAGLADGSLAFKDQVGMGTSEAYVKALQSDAFAVATYLPKARAAGKYNVTVDPGFNLISAPFEYLSSENSVASVFGAQLHSGTEVTGDRVYNKNQASSWGMPNAYLKSDGNWYWTNDPTTTTTISIEVRNGYLVENKGASIMITLVGRVPTEGTVTLDPGFNMIGTVFPIRLGLAGLGLVGTAGITAGNETNADRIYIKENAGSWGMRNAYLKSDGNWYLTSDPTVAADFAFNSPRGYFYEMKGTGQIVWIRSLP